MKHLLPSARYRVLSLALTLVLVLMADWPALAQLPNDECTGAIPVPTTANCAQPQNGTVQGATQSLPPNTACISVNTANDVWYSFVATGSSQTVILAPRFNAILDVRSGTCGSTSSVFCTTAYSGNARPAVVSGLSSGQTYFMRVYASGGLPPAGINSTFALCVSTSPLAPANDECTGAVPVPVSATATCASPIAGTVLGATQSLPVTATCSFGVNSANDVWYRFTATASSHTLTLNSTFGAIIDVRTGTCAASGSLVCTGRAFQGAVVSGLTSGQAYFLRIYANSNLQPANPTFTLCIGPGPAPVLNDECTGAFPITVAANCAAAVSGSVERATLSLPEAAACSSSFDPPTGDVWYFFTATGATQIVTFTPSYPAVFDVRSGTCSSTSSVFCARATGQPTVVSGLTTGQNYFIRVYGIGLTPPFNPAFSLCVGPGPVGPANDECTGAVPVSVSPNCAASVSGTVANASQSLPPTAGCGFGGNIANDVWYSFIATGPTQSITLTATGNVAFNVRAGACGATSSLFCSATTQGRPTVVGGLTSGQTYFIRVYANSATPTFTLCVGPGPVPPPNDECAGALVVPVAAGCTAPVSGTLLGASQSLPPTALCSPGVATANDVWFSFVATGLTHTILLTQISPASLGYGGIIEVRTGPCASSSSIFCGTTGPPNQAVLVGGLISGHTYFLRIYAGSNFPVVNPDFMLCIGPGPIPPPNDECSGAIPLPVTATCAAPITGNVIDASQSLPPSPNCGSNTSVANDVWYSFVATGATQALELITSTGFGVVLDVRTGPCGATTSVFCTTPFGSPTIIVPGLTSGQTYFLRLYPNGSIPQPNASFTLCLTAGPPAAPNNECATALPIAVTPTCASPTAGTVTGATQSLPPTAACGLASSAPQALDVWYFFVATATAHFITLTSSGLLALDVRTGTCATSTSVFCDRLDTNPATGVIVSGLTNGQSYFVRIYSSTGTPPTPAQAAFTLCINPAGPPANDEPCGATPLPLTLAGSSPQPITSYSAGATPSTQPGIGLPPCAPTPGPHDVWFVLTPPASASSLTLSLTGTAAGLVRVFSAPSCAAGPFALLACGSSGRNNYGLSSLTVPLAAPAPLLYVAVSSYAPTDAPGFFTIAASTLLTATRARSESSALVVYPNPSTPGWLTLRLSAAAGSSQITLFNSLGQPVLRQVMDARTTEQLVCTAGLPLGMYTLRVTMGNAVLTRKVALE